MEEKIIQAYMGEKYSLSTATPTKYDIKSALVAYFLGPALFFYYRSYLVGFLALFCQSIITTIISNLLHISTSTISIFVAILYGYITYPLYNKDARRKVKNLINKNSHLSEDELWALAAHKGRNNTIALVIYILLFILYIIISLLFLHSTYK